MVKKQTTKQCKKCGNTSLVLLGSMSIKICPDCNTTHKWELEKGQKPLITSSRDNGL